MFAKVIISYVFVSQVSKRTVITSRIYRLFATYKQPGGQNPSKKPNQSRHLATVHLTTRSTQDITDLIPRIVFLLTPTSTDVCFCCPRSNLFLDNGMPRTLG